MNAPRRVRFRAASPGLALNFWGVWDELSRCYAVAPKLSRKEAETRASEMDGASRGRGR